MRKGEDRCLRDYFHSCLLKSRKELAGWLCIRAKIAVRVLALLEIKRGQGAWQRPQGDWVTPATVFFCL